jgi:NO-binding membrane sensor protein with MHYT domain
MHPARLIGAILLGAVLAVMILLGAITLATRPRINFELTYGLLGVACGLLAGSLVALLVWRKDRED